MSSKTKFEIFPVSNLNSHINPSIAIWPGFPEVFTPGVMYFHSPTFHPSFTGENHTEPKVSRDEGFRMQLGGARGQQMSNEKSPGCLGCIGDYTTPLYGDFNKPI